MENKYEVFFNLDDITKDVYKKHFSEEKYDIILDEENILFVKKENKDAILEYIQKSGVLWELADEF